MRRPLLIGLLALGAVVAVVVGIGCGGGGGGYQVRAMFNNAFTVIAGEDVKVAGVKVGKIDSLDLDHNTAAVVLDITDPGFQDFRADASCTIRPQSLIGERYVECTPTQPHGPGEPPAPRLKKIQHGPGKGQYLLPVRNTINPIDLDLVLNTYRLPVRQRLSILVNELGTGLAGNGKALRQAVRNADPALRETDRVLALIAEQNQVLKQLADSGDRVLAPLAANREHVASFIDKANTTAQATAERRGDLEASLQKFPGFLRALKPTMVKLGALADQMTPAVTDLNRSGTDISRFIKGLGPFSQAGIPAIKSLGDASVPGRSALLAAKPVVGDLRGFASQGRPLVRNVADLLTSLQQTGGIERFMDFLYYGSASTNGFDEDGHYLRAAALVTNCLAYTVSQSLSCSANFQRSTASEATTARVKGGNFDGSKAKAGSRIALPENVLPGGAAKKTPATKRIATATTARASSADPSAALLDYLMGN